MTDSNQTKTLTIERDMPHSPAKIWRALTQGELIKEWLMDNDFQPVVGHSFQFRSKPVPGWNGIIDGEVLIVEPNKKLSYSWGSMGLNTVVAFTLAPSKTGTLVRMEQSGFRSESDANFKGATYGWQKFIGNLEQVAAKLS
jgi:uncharacterized protein YndB with AHSA1/START domain